MQIALIQQKIYEVKGQKVMLDFKLMRSQNVTALV